MSYHVAYYTNPKRWREAHWLTKAGVLAFLTVISVHQYAIRNTPEEKWRTPAAIAWRVHAANAQIAALGLIGAGTFLNARRRCGRQAGAGGERA